MARFLNEDTHRRAKPLAPAPFRTRALRLAKPDQPLAPFARIDFSAQRRSWGAFFRAVFKETDPVKLGSPDPPLKVSHVFLGLAWETDDKGRAHRDALHPLAELVDNLEIALAVARAQHRTQHF